jgi:hypothetical protein
MYLVGLAMGVAFSLGVHDGDKIIKLSVSALTQKNLDKNPISIDFLQISIYFYYEIENENSLRSISDLLPSFRISLLMQKP